MFWLADIFNGPYTQEEMKRYEQWARQERAKAVHQLFSDTGRGLARAAIAAARGIRATAGGLAVAYGKLRRWQRKRAAIRELSGLSDYLLKDIGLHRGDIRPVVEGLLDRKPVVRTEVRGFAPRQTAPVAEPSTDKREAANKWQRAA